MMTVKIFDRRAKTIIAIVCVFCIVFATTTGVLCAKLLTGLYLGEEIALESLDEQKDSVGMINILFLGVDDGGMRSDTIMLASVNGRTGNINVLSIPRDTRVLIGNSYQKINAAIGIGRQEVARGRLEEPEELCVQKVKLLTGLPVHYFASVDFDGFKDVIDALGGVDFEIPFDMKYDDPAQNLHINLKKGWQHLDGQAAHDFVRFRKGNPGYKGYATGDLGRIEAQQAFVKALIQQKLNAKSLLKIDELFEVVKKNVRTNYTTKDLIKHLGVIKNISAENIKMHSLPGTPQTINDVSYIVCNERELANLIDSVFNPNAEKETDK